jgi:hypothetical protein
MFVWVWDVECRIHSSVGRSLRKAQGQAFRASPFRMTIMRKAYESCVRCIEPPRVSSPLRLSLRLLGGYAYAIFVGAPTNARAKRGSPREALAFYGSFNRGDVDFLHGHHCGERALRDFAALCDRVA